MQPERSTPRPDTGFRNDLLPYGVTSKIDHVASIESFCFEITAGESVGIASPVFWKRLNERNAKFFEESIKAYPIDEYYPFS